jgi:hypothetical protein
LSPSGSYGRAASDPATPHPSARPSRPLTYCHPRDRGSGHESQVDPSAAAPPRGVRARCRGCPEQRRGAGGRSSVALAQRLEHSEGDLGSRTGARRWAPCCMAQRRPDEGRDAHDDVLARRSGGRHADRRRGCCAAHQGRLAAVQRRQRTRRPDGRVREQGDLLPGTEGLLGEAHRRLGLHGPDLRRARRVEPQPRIEGGGPTRAYDLDPPCSSQRLLGSSARDAVEGDTCGSRAVAATHPAEDQRGRRGADHRRVDLGVHVDRLRFPALLRWQQGAGRIARTRGRRPDDRGVHAADDTARRVRGDRAGRAPCPSDPSWSTRRVRPPHSPSAVRPDSGRHRRRRARVQECPPRLRRRRSG